MLGLTPGGRKLSALFSHLRAALVARLERVLPLVNAGERSREFYCYHISPAHLVRAFAALSSKLGYALQDVKLFNNY